MQLDDGYETLQRSDFPGRPPSTADIRIQYAAEVAAARVMVGDDVTALSELLYLDPFHVRLALHDLGDAPHPWKRAAVGNSLKAC